MKLSNHLLYAVALALLLIAGCGDNTTAPVAHVPVVGDGDGKEPNIILSDDSGCSLDSLNFTLLPAGTVVFSLEPPGM